MLRKNGFEDVNNLRGGMMAWESAKVTLAETRETIEDLAAEAQAEMAAESEPKPAKAAGKK